MDIRAMAEMFLDSGYSAKDLNETLKMVKEEREAETKRLQQESAKREAREDLVQAALNYALVAGLATKEEIDKVDPNLLFKYLDNMEKSIKTIKKIKVKPVDVDLDIIKRFVEGI